MSLEYVKKLLIIISYEMKSYALQTSWPLTLTVKQAYLLILL